jgi:DNA-directed RNA polymerase specialized sigma24 family protein
VSGGHPRSAPSAFALSDERARRVERQRRPRWTTSTSRGPWLLAVVKHEAFSIRRQRERAAPITDDGELRDPAAPAGNPHERSERYERLRQGAEALGRLKPQEVRALLLKAEGYSYREICAITGWTYTKV